MTRNRRSLVLLMAVLAAAGCSGVSEYYDSMLGRDKSEKISPLPEFSATAGAAVAWQGRAGAAEDYAFTPAVSGEAAYAAGRDGELARFTAGDGKPGWRVDTGHRLSAGVGAGGNLVLAGTPKGEVLAFDGNGKLLWQAQLVGEILSAPQAAGGMVVARSADGRIHGLDAASGARKWTYQRPAPALTVRAHSGVVIARGTVYAGFAGGKLVSLDLMSGSVNWEATVAQPRGVTELERISDVIGLPAADEKQVCAVAYQGKLACFDPVKGQLLWAREISSISGLALDERNVYVTDERSVLLALSKASGASVWKQDRLSGRRLGAPLVHGRFVAAGDYQGYVHFLNREDGSFAARIATDGSPVMPHLVLADGKLLAQTGNGGVYALEIR